MGLRNSGCSKATGWGWDASGERDLVFLDSQQQQQQAPSVAAAAAAADAAAAAANAAVVAAAATAGATSGAGRLVPLYKSIKDVKAKDWQGSAARLGVIDKCVGARTALAHLAALCWVHTAQCGHAVVDT